MVVPARASTTLLRTVSARAGGGAHVDAEVVSSAINPPPGASPLRASRRPLPGQGEVIALSRPKNIRNLATGGHFYQPSNIQIPYVERILLDKLAARLHQIA